MMVMESEIGVGDDDESVIRMMIHEERSLLHFARVSFEDKVTMLGRYGITEVRNNAPFENKCSQKWMPEGCHIQIFFVRLEWTLEKVVGYSP